MSIDEGGSEVIKPKPARERCAICQYELDMEHSVLDKDDDVKRTRLESVARECGPRSLAVLLTGMGRDGAAGMLALRRAGGDTIAQDEASSVVWGMPGEAVRLGAARRVLALDDIAPALTGLAAEGAA